MTESLKENDFISSVTSTPTQKKVLPFNTRAKKSTANSPLSDITLKSKSSFNSMNTVFMDKGIATQPITLGSPSVVKRPMSPRRSPKKFIPNYESDSEPEANVEDFEEVYQLLKNDYARLERLYADQLMKNSQLLGEQERLEFEVLEKHQLLLSSTNRIGELTFSNKSLRDQLRSHTELYDRDSQNFKEIKLHLENKIRMLQKILLEHETSMKLQERQVPSSKAVTDDVIRLTREYKILLTNCELEKSSKLILIDQIELLTQENQSLLNKVKKLEQSHRNLSTDKDQSYDDSSNDLDFHSVNLSKIQDLDDSDESHDNSNISNYKRSSFQMASLADELKLLDNHKEELEPYPNDGSSRDSSLRIASNFKFPANQLKKLPTLNNVLDHPSIDTKPLQTPSVEEELNFELSPFKLSAQSPVSRDEVRERRKTHSRFNSLDFMPIKVEFESQPHYHITSPNEIAQQRRRIESINEDLNNAINFNHSSQPSSKRNSGLFNVNPAVSAVVNSESSSKRNSSIYNPVSNNSSNRNSLIDTAKDESKQEIMKLKFELQSLRLQNEKLLSYIGFELQKNKHSRPNLSMSKIEYSDAKLIEQSKDMLIHKKRVLRSVSINPIMNKNIGKRRSNEKIGILESPINFYKNATAVVGLGDISENETSITEELINGIDEDSSLSEEYYVSSDEEDEYGFLKTNPTFGKRIFSNGLYTYFNYEQVYGLNQDIKKIRGLSRKRKEVNVMSETEEVETDVDTDCTGSIVLDNGEDRYDINDGLKYKFISIAIGIIIIGLKFHSSNYHE